MAYADDSISGNRQKGEKTKNPINSDRSQERWMVWKRKVKDRDETSGDEVEKLLSMANLICLFL